MTQVSHSSFVTTSARGLRQDILPMKLYHKAKRLGIWNPQSIDFVQDRLDWQKCTENEKETLLTLTALFQAGEESVTLDLLPLMMVVAQEGYLEEEMFLATFLWEEAKHVEFFRRFLDEVAEEKSDLHRYHSESYHRLFYEELPRAMQALITDHSAAALIKAAVTYNMIVEGVMAETGYHSYANMLARNNILPGLRQGLEYLKRDEARHIAYGIFLISRLISQDQSLWSVAEARMNELLPLAMGVIQELDVALGVEEERAFDIHIEDYLQYGMQQYLKRMGHIERAREQTLEELYHQGDSEDIVMGEVENA